MFLGIPPRSQGGISLPLAPTNITLADTMTVGETTINWTDGYDGGDDVIDYTIAWYQGGAFQGSKTTTSKPHTFTGPTAGQNYTFRVRARNIAGLGFESADSQLWRVATTVFFDNSNTFTAPVSKNYVFYLVGGGGGGGQDGANPYGAGGGGGYFSYNTITMAQGQQMTCNVGAGGGGTGTGGTSSINFVGSGTILSASGGIGAGTGTGANGGSGGGAGSYSNGNPGGVGGSGGTAGNKNSQSTHQGGTGQLGLAYGATSGRDDRIPSGGSGSYKTGGVSYAGIYGHGAGASGASDGIGTGRGCGSGGATWSNPSRPAPSGMIVIFG